MVKISDESHRGIVWFTYFIEKFNGKAFFVKQKVDKEIHLDACLEGIGAIFDKHIYQAKFPPFAKHFDIAALEMLNIFSCQANVERKNGKIKILKFIVITWQLSWSFRQ